MADKFDQFLDLILEQYWNRAPGQQASSLGGFTKEAWEKQRKQWGETAKGLRDQPNNLLLSWRLSDGMQARITGLESAVQWTHREYLSQYIFKDLGLLEKMFWRHYRKGKEPEQHEFGDVLHLGSTPSWSVSPEEFQEHRDILGRAWPDAMRRLELLEQSVSSVSPESEQQTPGPSTNIDGLKADEVEFLMRYAQCLSRQGQLPTYDQFARRDLGTSSKAYLWLMASQLANIGGILGLRDEYSGKSANSRPPSVGYFAEHILVRTAVMEHLPKDVLIVKATGLRDAFADTLGLRRPRNILQKERTRIIIECRSRGMTQQRIATELDAYSDLAGDPLLLSWAIEVLIPDLTWAQAFEHPKLQGRLKTLISKASEFP